MQHIAGHFDKESFQIIDRTGTDTHENQERIHGAAENVPR